MKDKIDFTQYQNGAEGFIRFCEEFIFIDYINPKGKEVSMRLGNPLLAEPFPKTGRSYASLWEKQKTVVKECLKMDDNVFRYQTIVLCWPRGEGALFLTCALHIWRFFCFKNINIFAISSDRESTLIVLPMIQRLITSNLLLSWHIQEIQEHLFYVSKIKKMGGNTIKAGDFLPRSDLSQYSFSFFKDDCQNNKKLPIIALATCDIPNAIGIIHGQMGLFLSQVYRGSKNNKSTTFFSYRNSERGDFKDFWHPHTTQKYLNKQRKRFINGTFERFFLNQWQEQ